MDDYRRCEAEKSVIKATRRTFRITNSQCVNVLPRSSTTLATWIREMYTYFQRTIVQEIAEARSRISISFDGWGSKYKKISLVGVVAHFVNSSGIVVNRLLGLPENPGHRKTGKGTCI